MSNSFMWTVDHNDAWVIVKPSEQYSDETYVPIREKVDAEDVANIAMCAGWWWVWATVLNVISADGKGL